MLIGNQLIDSIYFNFKKDLKSMHFWICNQYAYRAGVSTETAESNKSKKGGAACREREFEDTSCSLIESMLKGRISTLDLVRKNAARVARGCPETDVASPLLSVESGCEKTSARFSQTRFFHHRLCW